VRYTRLVHVGLVAFVFVERAKDYGGVHLGVPARSVSILSDLIDEVSRTLGHSRRVDLDPVPTDLPAGIADRPYRDLASLRLGSSTDGGNRIVVKGESALVSLSATSLQLLQDEIVRSGEGQGDVGLAGDSGDWSDRLWCWPLA
jgi:hypothetical protein